MKREGEHVALEKREEIINETRIRYARVGQQGGSLKGTNWPLSLCMTHTCKQHGALTITEDNHWCTVDSVITYTLFSPFFVDCHRCTVLSSFFKHSFKGHQPKEIRPKILRALLFETVEITLKKEVWVMTESTVGARGWQLIESIVGNWNGKTGSAGGGLWKGLNGCYRCAHPNNVEHQESQGWWQLIELIVGNWNGQYGEFIGRVAVNWTNCRKMKWPVQRVVSHRVPVEISNDLLS